MEYKRMHHKKKTHLESSVQLGHLLGVVPLCYPHALLHLLILRLHIFPYGNELVYRGFECPDEGFGVKRCSSNRLSMRIYAGREARTPRIRLRLYDELLGDTAHEFFHVKLSLYIMTVSTQNVCQPHTGDKYLESLQT